MGADIGDDVPDRAAQLRYNRAKFEERVRDRQRSYDAQLHRLGLLEKAFREHAVRVNAEREAREASNRAEALRAREEAIAAEKARRRAAKAEERREGRGITQEVLALMRRNGVLPGVNPPPRALRKDPEESDVRVILRLRDDGGEGAGRASEAVWSKSSGGKMPDFIVDLTRFGDAESIKGERIGPDGSRSLAELLAGGSCPRLAFLDLGWNGIRVSGFAAVLNALRSRMQLTDRRRDLVRLDVRANHITGEAMRHLGLALECGALPSLAHLDLRRNPLGDDGAKALVHIVLAGRLAAMETMNVSGCHIRDSGMRALCSGMNSKQLLIRLMPQVRVFVARDNRASVKVMRSCTWPPFVQV